MNACIEFACFILPRTLHAKIEQIYRCQIWHLKPDMRAPFHTAARRSTNRSCGSIRMFQMASGKLDWLTCYVSSVRPKVAAVGRGERALARTPRDEHLGCMWSSTVNLKRARRILVDLSWARRHACPLTSCCIPPRPGTAYSIHVRKEEQEQEKSTQ